MVAGCGKVGLSADSWLGWNEETTYGTLVGPSAGTEYALFSAEGMRGEIQVLSPPTISDAHREVSQVYTGRQIVSGQVTVPMVYEGFEHLLLHAFGEHTSGAGTSGTFLRTFDLSSSGRYRNANSPSLSIHMSRGIVGAGSTEPSVFSYAGCVVDEFSLACTRDGPLLLTLNFFGREETVATTSETVSLPTAPVANGVECTATWGSIEIPVADWTITARRQIDRERFFMGSTLSCEPPMGQYEVMATLNTEWDNEVRAGSTTLRADYAAATERQLKFAFQSTADITGTSQPYTLDWLLPKSVITAFPPSVQGVGRVLVPMALTGYDDDTSALPHEIRLLNVAENTFAE